MNQAIKYSILVLSIFLFIACDKSTLPPVDSIPEKGYFVVCEGNFNWGNASISSYDETKEQLTQEYFKAVNAYALGDVAQSMFETDDHYFIVVNNSGKIEMLEKEDFSSVATITGFESPRFFQTINDSVAYVSDLYADAIYKVDYSNGSITGSIEVDSWSEQMVMKDDSVYVCLYDTKQVAIINSLNDQVVNKIDLEMSPTQIRIDSEDKLWVLASTFGDGSTLYKINTANRIIENEWTFDEENSILQLETSYDGTKIYLLSAAGQLFKISNLDTSIINPLFTLELNSAYGLDIDVDGGIYICEAYDFTQAGSVSKYNESGVAEYSIATGVGPNSIVFR